MTDKNTIFTYLDMIAPVLPFPIYWGNLETLKVLGANEACLKAMGAKNPEEVIGKTPYQYYPKELADRIVLHAKEVAKAKKALTQEDVIRDISQGVIRYYNAIRAPLFDNVIGIVGTSIEITAEKKRS